MSSQSLEIDLYNFLVSCLHDHVTADRLGTRKAPG